ncbi:MAG: peptidylprolyl isomerase, partial [Dehalococcoidia bacterium]
GVLVVGVAMTAAAVPLGACGGGGEKATPTPSANTGGGQVIIIGGTPTSSQQSSPTDTPLPARAGDFASLCQKSTEKQWSSPPPMIIDPTRSYTATISTEKGDITVALSPNVAPIAVNNFVFLACKGYYEGVTFHRVIPGFVAQAGDPTGTGTGGPGYTIPDEFSSQTFDRGTLGMAKTGAPNSGGSQFFICLAAQPSLNGKYTVFGNVTAGMDVVDKLTPRDSSADSNAPPGDKILEITVQEH